jgi:hypothetical protein
LKSLLVGVDINLNAGPRTGERSYWGIPPVVRTVLIAIDEEAGIVATAVGATVTLDFVVVEACANLFGRAPEVIDGTLLVGENRAVWNEDAVSSNTLAGIWHVKGVVQGERCVVVLKAV